MNENYLAWVGQNATTGSANEKTGRMSMFGDYKIFETKKERDSFVNEFYNSSNPSEFAKKCTKRTGRKYSLGMTVRDYENHIDELIPE